MKKGKTMNQAIESTLHFTHEEGKNFFDDVTLFALSTCGFCKRAISFLRSNNVRFRFIYVDKLEMEIKQELKSHLRETYQKSVGFPFLVVDEKDVLVGFKEEEWKNLFSIE